MNQKSPIRVRIDRALLESDGVHEVLARLAWSAAGAEVEVEADFEPPAQIEVPAVLADEVVEACSRLRFVKRMGRRFQEKLLLVGSEAEKSAAGSATFVAGRHDANEGAEMTRLAYFARRKEIEAVRAASRRRLWEWRQEWSRFEKSYLVATGPSFERHREIADFEGAFVVTCNSAVIDREFMERARPSLVVFGDPIFHFGPSRYASDFRARLREAASEFDFRLAVSEKYCFLYQHCFPELVERTVFVPTDGNRANFHWRLDQDFAVKSTKNILTLLMLPFAAAFSREIKILGCDGRRLADDGYFWGHSAAAQLNDRMRNIQQAHPGFFAIDYNDYYLTHCRQLERFCRDLERAGIEVASVAPSRIPALSRRAVTEDLASVVDPDTENALLSERARLLRTRLRQFGPEVLSDIRFVSVNPSLLGAMGHPLYQDLSIREIVCPGGGGFVSLGDLRLDARQDGDERIGFALPVFETRIWQLHRRATGEEKRAMADAFVEELLDALEALDRTSPLEGAILFVYLGHPAVLPALARRWALKRFRCRRFVFNLFSGFFSDPRVGSDGAAMRAAALFARDMARFSDFVLVCDSAPFANDLRCLTGVDLPLLPMCPSQSFDSPRMGDSVLPAQAGGKRRLRVVYPSQSEDIRGFEVLTRFLYRHAEEFAEDFEFVIRLQPERKGAGFCKTNLRWVRGVLSETEYAALLAEADIALLPYSPEEFHYRTSSILAEAFSLGTPVVAMSDSWLGLQVAATGCGWIADRWDLESLRDVFQKIARDPEKARALHGAAPMKAWCEENRAERFVHAVLEARPAIFLTKGPGLELGERALFVDPREGAVFEGLDVPGRDRRFQSLYDLVKSRLELAKKVVLDALPIGLKVQLRTWVARLFSAWRAARLAISCVRRNRVRAGRRTAGGLSGGMLQAAPPEAKLRLDLDALWKMLVVEGDAARGRSDSSGLRHLEAAKSEDLALVFAATGSEPPSAVFCRPSAFSDSAETLAAAKLLDESGFQVWACQWHPSRGKIPADEALAWFRIFPFPSLPFDDMVPTALLAFRKPLPQIFIEKATARLLKIS